MKNTAKRSGANGGRSARRWPKAKGSSGPALHFTRLDPSRSKSARTIIAIERLSEKFRRRIKAQTVLPDAEPAPMVVLALMASGQIVIRKVDGRDTLSRLVATETLDLAT